MRMRAILAATLLLVPIGTMAAPEPACAASSCCKTCKKGKPCGDSCIAADIKCTRPKGCACAG